MTSSGAQYTDASGNRNSPKRRKPYVPSLSITPARITEPAVGAWVWASGSQVCTGHNGTLTAKATAKERNSHRAVTVGMLGSAAILTRSKVRA